MIKPRSEWDREDLLDYLDGWHAESGLGFKVERDTFRRVVWLDPAAVQPNFPNTGPVQRQRLVTEWLTANTLVGKASMVMLAGRTGRIAHREATGI